MRSVSGDPASPEPINLAEIRTRPHLVYERVIGERACLRTQNAGDRLDGLLCNGEVVEFLCKAGIEHRAGSRISGVALPPSPRGQDIFVLIPPAALERFRSIFEVDRPPDWDDRTRTAKVLGHLRVVV